MPLLQQNGNVEVHSASLDAAAEQKQRRRMLTALAMLLVALIFVVIKDWDFWFPSAPDVETQIAEPSAPAQSQPQTGNSPIAPPTKPRRKTRAASGAAPAPAPAVTPEVTANRTVLPPLEVEVVAGDQHRPVQPGNPSVKVDMQPGSPATSAQPAEATANTDTEERVSVSPGTAQVVSHQVDPSYPLLAKQMKVQGAVVLQALIGKSGSIQDLQVLSGPAILSEAARQAVKQWRFKPYLQSGQPVDTAAKITVNFTISTY